jgi:hypothetical protein
MKRGLIHRTSTRIPFNLKLTILHISLFDFTPSTQWRNVPCNVAREEDPATNMEYRHWLHW